MIIHKLTTPKPKQSGRAYRAPWYDTTLWRAQRLEYIKQHPECELHLERGQHGIPSTVVDHIKNIASYPEDQREAAFWNQGNWQALCSQCHNSKSGRER